MCKWQGRASAQGEHAWRQWYGCWCTPNPRRRSEQSLCHSTASHGRSHRSSPPPCSLSSWGAVVQLLRLSRRPQSFRPVTCGSQTIPPQQSRLRTRKLTLLPNEPINCHTLPFWNYLHNHSFQNSKLQQHLASTAATLVCNWGLGRRTRRVRHWSVQLRRRDWSRRGGGGEVPVSDRWGFERLGNGNGHNRSGTPWRRPRGREGRRGLLPNGH